MSWLSSFMHPGRAYQKEQEQLDKYYNEAQGQLNPFINNASGAFVNMNNAQNALMNPQYLLDLFNKGYNESDVAKQSEAMAGQHGLNAASSMGIMGSTPALSAIQSGTAGIAAQDKQNYLNDMMQKYMQGVGINQNIYGTGAQAAGQGSQNAMQMGDWSNTNAANRQSAGGRLFGGLLGTGATLLGGALGGPMGAAAGNAIGNAWSTGGQ